MSVKARVFKELEGEHGYMENAIGCEYDKTNFYACIKIEK
jgi:hypothetical protein